MAKHKVWDMMRIVDHRTFLMNGFGEMDKWPGKVMTIRSVSYSSPVYRKEEDFVEYGGRGWMWDDSMIAGLVNPDRSSLIVEISFDGNTTRAALIKDGREVKSAEARCSPSDTFDRGEGAKVAVNRLFAKKEKPKKGKTPGKPDLNGHMFIVTGDCHLPTHFFPIGEKVLRVADSGIPGVSKYVSLRTGLMQSVADCDVKPV